MGATMRRRFVAELRVACCPMAYRWWSHDVGKMEPGRRRTEVCSPEMSANAAVRSSAVDDDITEAPVGNRDPISHPNVDRNMLVSRKLECAVVPVARLVPGWGMSNARERIAVPEMRYHVAPVICPRLY